MTYRKYFFIIILSLLFIEIHHPSFAQEDHGTEIHNEISAGAGIASLSEATGISPALHFHAIKGLTPSMGIGLGYELIIGNNLHQSLGAFFSYKPHRLIDINIGPGVVLPSTEEAMSLLFSGEIALSGHISKHIHLGPVLDFGWSAHGTHTIIGIHCGFDL